jgi:hypothetical protein
MRYAAVSKSDSELLSIRQAQGWHQRLRCEVLSVSGAKGFGQNRRTESGRRSQLSVVLTDPARSVDLPLFDASAVSRGLSQMPRGEVPACG